MKARRVKLTVLTPVSTQTRRMRDVEIKKDSKSAIARRVGDILQMAQDSDSRNVENGTKPNFREKVDGNPVIDKKGKSPISGVKCAPSSQLTPPPSLVRQRVSPTVIASLYRTSLFQESSFTMAGRPYGHIILF